MAAFGGVAAGGAVGGGIVHLDVEQVWRVFQVADHLMRFGRGDVRRAATQFLHGYAQGDGAAAMGGFAHGIDQLFDQTHAVADRSAVVIGAVVVVGQQELIGQIAHSGIDVEDVEARLFGPDGRLGMPADQIADIGSVHDAGPCRGHEGHMCGHPRHARW